MLNNNFTFENLAFYGVLLKNIVETDWPQMADVTLWFTVDKYGRDRQMADVILWCTVGKYGRDRLATDG